MPKLKTHGHAGGISDCVIGRVGGLARHNTLHRQEVTTEKTQGHSVVASRTLVVGESNKLAGEYPELHTAAQTEMNGIDVAIFHNKGNKC